MISQQDLSPSLPRRRSAAAPPAAAAGPPRRAEPPPPDRHAGTPRRSATAAGPNCRTTVVGTAGLRIAGHHRPGLDCVIRHGKARAGWAAARVGPNPVRLEGSRREGERACLDCWAGLVWASRGGLGVSVLLPAEIWNLSPPRGPRVPVRLSGPIRIKRKAT